jgi:hypothetical protein
MVRRDTPPSTWGLAARRRFEQRVGHSRDGDRVWRSVKCRGEGIDGGAGDLDRTAEAAEVVCNAKAREPPSFPRLKLCVRVAVEGCAHCVREGWCEVFASPLGTEKLSQVLF